MVFGPHIGMGYEGPPAATDSFEPLDKQDQMTFFDACDELPIEYKERVKQPILSYVKPKEKIEPARETGGLIELATERKITGPRRDRSN